jgi:hypothetical protein
MTRTKGGSAGNPGTAVDRGEWVTLLDKVTADHEGQYVTIEVLGSTFGDEEAADRLPFVYATYDPRDDVVIVAVGGRSGRYPVVLRHMVDHPTEVAASEADRDGAGLKVVEADGTTTIVGFYPDRVDDS